MTGHTVYASVSYFTKYPAILPRYHQVTLLVVAYYYGRILHKNHETPINELRQQFVIRKITRGLREIKIRLQIFYGPQKNYDIYFHDYDRSIINHEIELKFVGLWPFFRFLGSLLSL